MADDSMAKVCLSKMAFLAGVAAVFWGLAGVPVMAQAPKRVVLVEAVPTEIRAVEEEVKAVGSLKANEAVVIRPEIAGRVVALPFEEGASVEKNAPLVRLDATAYQAELVQAESALNLSRRNFDRVQELVQKKAASTRARDEAQAKLDNDRAAVDLARIRLDKTEIRAPFSGLIGLRKVSVGAYVTAGQDIVDLVSTDPIKVDFSISERFLPMLKVGQKLEITVDAYPGESFSGEVYALSPQVDPLGRSLALRAEVTNPEGRLKAGLFARVRLVVATRTKAVIIPEQAVFAQAGKWYVYRVIEGKAQLTPIETGVRRPGWVEIATGLAEGDVVVTAGHIKLHNGAAVEVQGQKPAQPVAAKEQ